VILSRVIHKTVALQVSRVILSLIDSKWLRADVLMITTVTMTMTMMVMMVMRMKMMTVVVMLVMVWMLRVIMYHDG